MLTTSGWANKLISLGTCLGISLPVLQELCNIDCFTRLSGPASKEGPAVFEALPVLIARGKSFHLSGISRLKPDDHYILLEYCTELREGRGMVS